MAELSSANPAVEAYAQAMLDLAAGAGELEPMAEELDAIQQMLTAQPDFATFMESPGIGQAERAAALRQVFTGRVSSLTMNLLGVLNSKGRLGLLRYIGQAYRDLLDKRQGRVKAELTVAVSLSDLELEQIRQQLGAALKKDVTLSTHVDESILGGLVVRVQDRLMDASVRAQLDAMKRQLIASRV